MSNPSEQAMGLPENIASSGGSAGTIGQATGSSGGCASTGEVGPGPLAGTKRPSATLESLPPINRDGRNLSEKKLRRLEKNRLSARECRRKKREAAQNLEREIIVLEAENLRLRLQLQIGEEAEKSNWKEQEKITEGLDALLKSGASESEIYGQIEEFKEKFADYGRDRRTAIEFHLRNVARLLLPTTTTSVAMRALQGGPMSSASRASNPSAKDVLTTERSSSTAPAENSSAAAPVESPSSLAPAESSSSAAPVKSSSAPAESVSSAAPVESSSSPAPTESPPSAAPAVAVITPAASTEPTALPPQQTPQQQPPLEPKALFQYLVNYLEVTPDQAAALKDSRSVAKELDSSLQQALAVHDELRQRLTQVGEDLEAEMNSVRAILTPTQAAKFLVWVANNGACMHMLNELWSKVYPKPDPTEEDAS